MRKSLLRLASALLVLTLLLGACSRGSSSGSQDPSGSGGAGSSGSASISSSSPAGGAASVPAAPPEPVVAHLMAAGDIMSHMPITEDAYVAATGEYDYTHMYRDAAQQLQTADYAVANLETPLAGGPDYSGYPAFNAPDALAVNAKEAGFDLLSTANNHTKDRGMDGIFRTLDVLDQNGIAHVGTYRSQEERDANSGIVVADVGGISVAFVCYTYGLNGMTIDADKMYSVNLFNNDYATTLSDPNYALMEADMAAARALNADMIAVMIHWGVEYRDVPTDYQTSLAEWLVGQGADLVLGGHPHVIEPYETITTTGWDGQQRKGFVIYSMGNFISNQYDTDSNELDIAKKTSLILDMELTKDPATGNTELTAVSYTPYYMVHRDNAAAGDRRYLVNIHNAMAAYESGDTSVVNANIYGGLQLGLEHCHKIFGTEGDSFYTDGIVEVTEDGNTSVGVG